MLTYLYYPPVQWVLKGMDNSNITRKGHANWWADWGNCAQVAAYFQRFDEAESLYREIDRKAQGRSNTLTTDLNPNPHVRSFIKTD